MSSSKVFDAVKSRRSYYQLEASSPIADDAIHEIVKEAVLHVPSSFNSQSTRVVVLLAGEHKKLWEEIVKVSILLSSSSSPGDGALFSPCCHTSANQSLASSQSSRTRGSMAQF